MKNQFKHNEDGTTHIFIESKSKKFPGSHIITIDAKNWDKVKEHRWYLTAPPSVQYPYAQATIPHPDRSLYCYANGRVGPRRTTLLMHTLIIGKPEKGMIVDHINHNGLDNTEKNLRFVTRAQNIWNSRGRKNTTSQYKGVYKPSSSNSWIARLRTGGEQAHIGSFTCEEQAARAYDRKALELWGEYAYTNFPKEDYLLDNRKQDYRKKTSSQYRGVTWHKGGKKWQAATRHDGKNIYLGHFTCEKEAARAYNKKAIELRGEYALLNEIAEERLKELNNGKPRKKDSS
jgi:hypothetical protein